MAPRRAADWEGALAQLRAALPACRVAMRVIAPADALATEAAGGRARRAADYRAGRLAGAAASAALDGAACLAGRGSEGRPLWRAGLAGSISHSEGRAIALLGHAADWHGLGVDLERRLSRLVAQEIAPVALTTAERAAFGADPLWVGLIFSAKESLFKALSPLIGRRFDFDAAQMVPGAPGRWPQLRLACDLAPGWAAGCVISPVLIACPQGVITAVALPRGAVAPGRMRRALQPRSVAPPSI